MTWIQTDFFWCCRTSFLYAYSSPYALRLLCFALFPRLSPWQPWQLGTPAKVLPLFYPFGRFECIKTVLMGTYTPHTWIPGLVWQKQARRFSQFELQVGELGFPIHFVCVSAALYHRGHAAAIFPLRWIRSIECVVCDKVRDTDSDYVMRKPSRCWLGAVPRYWNVVATCFRFIGFAENTSAALAPRAGISQPILLLFFLFSCSWICLQNVASDFFIPSQNLVAFERRQNWLKKGYFPTFPNI